MDLAKAFKTKGVSDSYYSLEGKLHIELMFDWPSTDGLGPDEDDLNPYPPKRAGRPNQVKRPWAIGAFTVPEAKPVTDFGRQAAQAGRHKAILLEALAQMIVKGMGLPLENCHLVHQAVRNGAERFESFDWIEAKDRPWPPAEHPWKVVPCAGHQERVEASVLLLHATRLQDAAQVGPYANDQGRPFYLALAMVELLGANPTNVELVTKISAYSSMPTFYFQRRNAGPSDRKYAPSFFHR